MEQLSALGPFIGTGNTADVYQYNSQYVIKLYKEKFGPDLARFEQDVLRTVNGAGAPSPVAGSLVQFGTRVGLKMEFVQGRTLDQLMAEEPAQLVAYARLMSSLHAGMHATVTDQLQTQHTALSDRIRNNEALLGDLAGIVSRYLETLPSGNQVCHGDVHPKNVLASPEKSTVIDWTNAYRGTPLSDVTMTRLRLLSPYVPKGFTGDAGRFLAAKKVVFEAYMREYTKITGVVESDLQAWLLPCAAAQLHASKPVHTRWLLGIINGQIRSQA